jgi:hypothetical protein
MAGSVDQLRQWITTNSLFTKYFGGSLVEKSNDVFMPSEKKYPHIHIGKDFVTLSKNPQNHIYLIEKGGTVMKNRIIDQQKATTDFDMKQVLGYMALQL